MGGPGSNGRFREGRVISQGASNKEAARELVHSPGTVRTHVENIFHELERSSRCRCFERSALAVDWRSRLNARIETIEHPLLFQK
jgi:DNA-binding NarL/FixJ family response regulator